MMSVEITTPAPSHVRPILCWLFDSPPDTNRIAKVEGLLVEVHRSRLTFDGLRVAIKDGAVVAALLGILQPDGTVHVYPPRLAEPQQPVVVEALTANWLEWLEATGAKRAQCLSQLDDVASHQWLERSGFTALGNLVCWHHDLKEIPERHSSIAIQRCPYSSEYRERFERVIEQSLANSHDCQYVRGRCTAHDILTGHLAAASDDAIAWSLYADGHDDIAVVMCADRNDQQMWELLYIGVVPKFRRRGIARHIVCQVLLQARDAGAMGLFLAADDANKAATKLYTACGFKPAFQERIHARFWPRERDFQFTSSAQR